MYILCLSAWTKSVWITNCNWLVQLLLYSTYGDAILVKELAERVASYVHLCTLYWWLRLGRILFLVNVTTVIFHGYTLIIYTFSTAHPADVFQALGMWSDSWRLWQGWTSIIHGWTFWHLLCELILPIFFDASDSFLSNL